MMQYYLHNSKNNSNISSLNFHLPIKIALVILFFVIFTRNYCSQILKNKKNKFIIDYT